MAPNLAQRGAISAFMSITGVQEKVAMRYLKNSGWKIDLACDAFYAQNSGGSAAAKDRQALAELFEQYRGKGDEPDIIGVDGMLKWLADLEVDVESAAFLVPLQIVQSQTFGVLVKDDFITGWSAVGASTLQAQKTYVAQQITNLSTDRELFKLVYRHTFNCSREKSQKALPLESAMIYWTMLFTSPGPSWTTASTNWLDLWQQYLKSKWTKSVNKDMWNQLYEFYSRTLEDETLGFWSEDGAWPSVIDDFVSWVKVKGGKGETMETD